MSVIGMAIRLISAGVVLSGWIWILGPLMAHSADSPAVRGVPPIRHSTATDHAQSATTRISADDFTYLGAFRLPGGEDKPQTFAYGGSAMTYHPAGDHGGSGDGFPGSLFIMGHNRQPYGELPNGNQVAEVTIPRPVQSANVAALNQAAFLQGFTDVAAGRFSTLDEIPRTGMQYLNTPATGARIHLAWGQHLQDGEDTQVASHAWFSPTLSTPNFQGAWWIGNQSLYSVNGYMMDIPTAWADSHAGGRPLATGRYRDGGWSGMGPALFAYKPWTGSGTPAAPGTRLSEEVLLLYAKSNETENIEQCLNGYQHADEWEGGAWITTADGRSAVLFAGTKGTGAKYWYGWINPAGPQYPCVETEFLGQFPLCRLADGSWCPGYPDGDDWAGCSHTSERGWWSSSFEARFILYDPDDLASVASGAISSWQPQPYATISINDRLFKNPDGVDIDALGTGVQRRYRIGDVAYDRANNLLYVLELFADGAKPVVHVWRIGGKGAPRRSPIGAMQLLLND